ncbi:MAG TPA: hypothetical protein VGH73_06055 [Thermoanaerobaculia bacterium]
MRKILAAFGILLGLSGAALPAHAAAGDVRYAAQVTAVSTSPVWIELTHVDRKADPATWRSNRFTVPDTAKTLQETVKQLHVGDLVSVTASGDMATLVDVKIRKVSVSFLRTLITLILVALGLWGLTWLLTKRGVLLSHFILGRDNRYSKSKFQIALWFSTVMVA